MKGGGEGAIALACGVEIAGWSFALLSLLPLLLLSVVVFTSQGGRVPLGRQWIYVDVGRSDL